MSKLTAELEAEILELNSDTGINFGVSVEKVGRAREYSLTIDGLDHTMPLPYKEFIRMIYGIRIGSKLKVNKTELVESVIQEEKEDLEEMIQNKPIKKKLPWE